MQQSTITALRTLVMLLSLLAIPLAAIVGTGSWPRIHGMLGGLKGDLIAKLNGTPASAAKESPAPLGPLTKSDQPAAPTATVPPQTAIPAPFSASAPAAKLDPQTMPASFIAPSELPPVARPRSASEPPPASTDLVAWTGHRLQTLGAEYYRLETAGEHGEMFRFHCKMTSASNPNYVRYFEATAADPQRAMQHVLDQVDAWMASRETLRR